MSEVEKMYTLAMVEPTEITVCGIDEEIIHYPPFTAEKQLKLIKFLLDKYCDIRIRKNLEGDYYIKSFNDISCFSEDFEETLASFTNTHLQDLTEEEKQQVKGILE